MNLYQALTDAMSAANDFANDTGKRQRVYVCRCHDGAHLQIANIDRVPASVMA